ncbi:hypothetical protein HKX48_007526 [Thoreauomyces humboldtii]|nr:hypothetical protein HKX48_007526 [Thoreauomyces humboldtii]
MEDSPSTPNGVAEDDIQRFKAQMRKREGVNQPQPPTESVFSNVNGNTARRPQPQQARDNDAENVDAFFDMNFDVHQRVPVNHLFEKPANESPVSTKQSEKSRFARFWSEESDENVPAPQPEAETMHRIGISDLFDSARIRPNGPHQPDHQPIPNGRTNMPPPSGAQRLPQMMSEEDILMGYNKDRNRPSSGERPRPSNPSEQDRAGINRVMEKLAVFGINQPPPPPPVSNVHLPPYSMMEATSAPQNPQQLRMHPQYDRPPHMAGPPPALYDKDPTARFNPQSLYRNNVNMGLNEDPSSQLTAMIQAASKAKQNQNQQFPAQDLPDRYKHSGPPDMMGGMFPNGPLLPPGVPHPHNLNGPPPFMPGHMNGHLPPHLFPPNGPMPPFLPPHMLPPNPQHFPPHPGMFPGHPYGHMPPPFPMFVNQQGPPVGMKSPPGTEGGP